MLVHESAPGPGVKEDAKNVQGYNVGNLSTIAAAFLLLRLRSLAR
jgi:hypothetical protein